MPKNNNEYIEKSVYDELQSKYDEQLLELKALKKYYRNIEQITKEVECMQDCPTFFVGDDEITIREC